MKEQLYAVKERAKEALALASTSEELEAIRVRFAGKKGELTALLSQMGKLTPEERPVIGQIANEVRTFIDAEIRAKKTVLEQAELNRRLEKEALDVTLPGKERVIGKQHPLNLVLDEIKDAFISMGFSIASGPEVEYDYYNFEALNIPQDHPARRRTPSISLPRCF